MRFFSKKGTLLLALAMTGLGWQAQAQSESETTISLQKALEVAVQNYPKIKAAQASKNSAVEMIKSGRAEYNPAVVLQEQVTLSSNNAVRGSFFPNEGWAMPNSGSVRPDGQNSYTGVWGNFTTLGVNWKFFNFGKIKARVNQAKAEGEVANAEYENEVFQHKVKVTDAYLALLVNQKIVRLQENNLQRALTLKSATDAAVKSGLRPGADSAYVNAEVSKARLMYLASQGREKEARIQLAELLGMTNSTIQVDSLSFFNTAPQLQQNESFDVKSHPLLALYRSQIEMNERKAVAIQRSYLPSISFLAIGTARGTGNSNTDLTVQNTSLGAGLHYKAFNYLTGVSLLWNIMDYPRIRYQYKGQMFQAQRARALYEEQSLRLQGQNENANIQMEAAQAQLRETPVQLASARQAYSQSQARYKTGLATLPELAQNFLLLNRAEIDQSIAYNNVWRALLIKAAASGDYSIFLNQVK